MRTFLKILTLCCVSSTILLAQPNSSYNNITKQYTLISLTESLQEAARMQRLAIADYQPTGLYIGNGEDFVISIGAIDTAYRLVALIGFKPLWGHRNKFQEVELKSGENKIRAANEGVLFLTFVKRTGLDIKPITLNVSVQGGRSIPMYQQGITTATAWKQQLDSFNKAVFVQLVSPKAMITIPYENYIRAQSNNLENTFDTIHKVIDWANECAGFYGNTPTHMPSRLRMHYVVDTYKQNGDGYYMYTTGYHIGILRDNFEEITNPKRLAKDGWGIWHETGHTHQQPSWRWGAIVEISVNITSLYVQEKFEQPTPFNKPNSAKQGVTLFENVKRYLDLPNKDYNNHKTADDVNPLFSKMMMFWQLKEHYGWQIIQNVHRYFRENPARGGNDQEKIDRFIYATCLLSKNDLRNFFNRWGLKITDSTNQKIANMRWSLPSRDPSTYLTDKWKPKPIDTKKWADEFLVLQNEYRKSKKLNPFKFDTAMLRQSMIHCTEMLQKGGYSFGDYGRRLEEIKRIYGSACKPSFNMVVADAESAADLWNAYKKNTNAGGADDDYDLAGIFILRDPREPNKFYVSQHFGSEVVNKKPEEFIAELLKEENDYRKSMGLAPFEIKAELNLAAQQHAQELFNKRGYTFGDYITRYKVIREKLGNTTRPELHMGITEIWDAKAVVKEWSCTPGAARRNLDSNCQYTGFGVIVEKGTYFITQYFACMPLVK